MFRILLSVFLLISLSTCGAGTTGEPTLIQSPPMWGRTPLTVSVDTYSGRLRDSEEAAEKAIESFNNRLGFTLIRQTYESPSDIKIIVGYPRQVGEEEDARVGGKAKVYYAGRTPTMCEIRVYGTMGVRTTYLVVYHELGHCFGLAHDRLSTSIMNPAISEAAEEDVGFFPQLSPRDRAALRELYLR